MSIGEFTVSAADATARIQQNFGNAPFAACGLGAVVSLSGKPTNDIFQRAFLGLANLAHRGAESADGKSGDGAGILFQLPQDYFRSQLRQISHQKISDNARIGVGQVFLPKEEDYPEEHAQAKQIVEDALVHYGIKNYVWRDVKINSGVLGPIAAGTEPDTQQIVFECPKGKTPQETKKLLHEAMLEAEKRIRDEESDALNSSFYICSLSADTIVYKAMVQPADLINYYQDLAYFNQQGETAGALIHQRFATNAAPQWRLAHPYREIAHNGEVNTIASTAQHAKARTREFVGDDHRAIQTSGSDTAQLDTIIHLMNVNGWEPLHAVRHLIPPALHPSQNADFQTYVRATQALSDQADGPAALAAFDGDDFVMALDRNALRPMNIVQVGDDVLICASEVGIGLRDEDQGKVQRAILKNGEAVAVNVATGKYLNARAVEQHLSSLAAHTQWIRNVESFSPRETAPAERLDAIRNGVQERQNWLDPQFAKQLSSLGYNYEDVNSIIRNLTEDGKEMVFSMGDAKPLAVLSNNSAVHVRFTNFLKQRFAQVTNPPIDSIKEADAFDMVTRLGNRGDIVSANPKSEKPLAFDIIELPSALLWTHEFEELKDRFAEKEWKHKTLDATFRIKEWRSINDRVAAIVNEAVQAVESGHTQLIVSHKGMDKDNAAIPSQLIISAIDKELKARSLRSNINIHGEVADVRDTNDFAAAITFGADTIIPYVAEDIILRNYPATQEEPRLPQTRLATYKKGMETGLMKTMSKMGITTLNSYRGGRFYSVLGLSRALTEDYLGDSDVIVSPISGMELHRLAYKIARHHSNAYSEERSILPAGSLLRTEEGGGRNAHTSTSIRLLHEAVDPKKGGYEKFKAFVAETQQVREDEIQYPDGRIATVRAPIYLRDLFELKNAVQPLALDEVQDAGEIIRGHFGIAPMSFGALGPEAILSLNQAGAELGMDVNSGEGGERRDLPYKASTKQVASGRFGADNWYLNTAQMIQIKMAQGAKPGEGGQLMGPKVSEEIAANRRSTPGVSLISPPPHHDIYSIEDLAQLIRDLKAVNPKAGVSVKLVAESGVGEVAAGCVKTGANEVHISGNDGGTGAASVTSINNAGWPMEIGLPSTQQNLVAKGMRAPTHETAAHDQAVLSADGSIRTGRDVIIAAILGADKVKIGTMALVAGGCLLVRQCHSNTCPTGIATQNPDYRAKIAKDAAQRVKNYFTYLAEDVREHLARLGVKSLPELRGRTDILLQLNRHQAEKYAPQVRDLDLDSLLHVAAPPANIAEIRASYAATRKAAAASLDEKAIARWDEVRAAATPEAGPVVVEGYINNTNLDVGTRIGGEVTRAEMKGEQTRTIHVNVHGYAGQSLAAWLPKGVEVTFEGYANDGVGKGLSGGTLVLKPPANQNVQEKEPSAIAGNACLYGKIEGDAYFDGPVGNRFAVRHSGGLTVVDGAGDYAFEYMTGGIAISAGHLGKGAFAGMSGGIAFVYDPVDATAPVARDAAGIPMEWDVGGKQIVRFDGKLQHDENYEGTLRAGLQSAADKTGNAKYSKMIADLDTGKKGNFWIVIPDEFAAARKNILARQAAESRPALTA
jgi:glutamate synthase (NADPH/NADH) large chain